MEKVYVCFRWQFILSVSNRKGKKYNKNHISALGTNYDQAKCSIQNQIKKKALDITCHSFGKSIRSCFCILHNSGMPMGTARKI
jgi:hypothetical protein